MKLLLASASPARRKTLIAAGITPLVQVSNAPEAELLAQLRAQQQNPSPAEQVQLLASAKARDIATRLQIFHSPDGSETLHSDRRDTAQADKVAQNEENSADLNEHAVMQADKVSPDEDKSADENPLPRVIVGCDSMFAFDGIVVGKPHTPEVSRQRLRRMRGNYGELYTGHCVIDTRTGATAEGVSCARVYISEMSDAEIEAYISTGEPLVVAGSFTIDGFGGPFVEKIVGDHHGVVGISLPLLRQLLAKLGLSIIDFWDQAPTNKKG